MSNEPTPLDDFEPIDDLELPVSLPPNRSTPVVIVDEAKYLAMQQRIRELEAGYEARGKTIDAMAEDVKAMHAEIEQLRAKLAPLRGYAALHGFHLARQNSCVPSLSDCESRGNGSL